MKSFLRPTLVLSASAALLLGVAASTASAAIADDPGAGPPSAASGRIAYVHRHQISTIDADGTDRVALTSDGRNGAPVWSPDGTLIAYVHSDGDGRNLWVMAADGSDKRPVTTTGRVNAGGASWSPDGTQLAFGGRCMAEPSLPDLCAGNPRSVLDVVTVQPTIGAPTTLAGSQNGSELSSSTVLDRVAWSANANDIAFASNAYSSYPGDEYVLVHHLTTATVTVEVAVGAGGVYGQLANPAFSPDGERLAYDAYIYGQPEIINEGIRVCPYPDGACDLFKDVLHDSQLAFASDGGRVALVRDLEHDRIVVADADGTHRDRLVRGTRPSWQPTA